MLNLLVPVVNFFLLVQLIKRLERIQPSSINFKKLDDDEEKSKATSQLCAESLNHLNSLHILNNNSFTSINLEQDYSKKKKKMDLRFIAKIHVLINNKTRFGHLLAKLIFLFGFGNNIPVINDKILLSNYKEVPSLLKAAGELTTVSSGIGISKFINEDIECLYIQGNLGVILSIHHLQQIGYGILHYVRYVYFLIVYIN